MEFIDKIALYRFCDNFIYQLPHGDPSEVFFATTKFKTQALLRIFSFERSTTIFKLNSTLTLCTTAEDFLGSCHSLSSLQAQTIPHKFPTIFSFTTFSLKSVTVQTTRNRKCKWLERSTRENSDLRMNCVCEVGVNLHSKGSKRLCCWKNEGGWGRRGRERGWWCLHSSSKLVEKILIVIYISYTDE